MINVDQSLESKLPSSIQLNKSKERNSRERLGGGGEAIVFAGQMEDESGHLINVAIKECTNPFNRQSLAAFRNEQKVLAAIPKNAQHLVRGIYFGDTFTVLERHGDGTNLEAYARSGVLTPGEVMTILRQVAFGLDELYLLSIDNEPVRYHGDLKLNNCVIDPETNEIRIADFSMVNRLKHQSGTLDFMSPEVVSPNTNLENLDWKVDLFALAIMAYRLLTKKHPVIDQQAWEDVEVDKIKKQIANPNTKLLILLPTQSDLNKKERSTVQEMRKNGERLENLLQTFFAKALAANPQDRYESHWHFISDLEKIILQIDGKYRVTSFEDLS